MRNSISSRCMCFVFLRKSLHLCSALRFFVCVFVFVFFFLLNLYYQTHTKCVSLGPFSNVKANWYFQGTCPKTTTFGLETVSRVTFVGIAVCLVSLHTDAFLFFTIRTPTLPLRRSGRSKNDMGSSKPTFLLFIFFAFALFDFSLILVFFSFF